MVPLSTVVMTRARPVCGSSAVHRLDERRVGPASSQNGPYVTHPSEPLRMLMPMRPATRRSDCGRRARTKATTPNAESGFETGPGTG